MADGDFDVKTLFTTNLAGGGRSLTGVAKNAKVQVLAEITGTYNTGGIVVSAADLGMTTIDALFITQVYSNNTTVASATVPRSGVFLARSGSAGNIILVTNASTQAEAADSQTFAICVLAFGDSAAAPELT